MSTLSILYHSTYSSPLGDLQIICHEGQLVALAFDESKIQEHLLHVPFPYHFKATDKRLDFAKKQLDTYFLGKLKCFTLPISLLGLSSFRQAVLKKLLDIPYGKTSFYTQVAEQVGLPQAARAIGSACGANPLPIIIPCHRVVPRCKNSGGYNGGMWRKNFLLALEQNPSLPTDL